MTKLRKVVKIDEEKCDGCGLCVPACAEGAIRVVDGKARLVGDKFCDGLGACLGECPKGAITIEDRAAEEFDPVAVEKHLAAMSGKPSLKSPSCSVPGNIRTGGCPGIAAQVFAPPRQESLVGSRDQGAYTSSMLGNWPLQINLVPIKAPYFDGARMLISADCVPFAFPDFHRKFLDGRLLMIGCPKLDDIDLYHQKLVQIFLHNQIKDIEVVYMEVPCCQGLVRLVERTLEETGKKIPATYTKVSIHGDLLEKTGSGVSA